MTEDVICAAGCKRYYKDETKHFRDCPFYEGSLTMMNDKVKKAAEQMYKALVKVKEYDDADGSEVLDIEAVLKAKMKWEILREKGYVE